MADVRKFIGAGLKDAKLRNSDGDLIDIYGVVQAEGSQQRENTEVKGDDTLLGVFNSSISEDLTIECNGLTFDVVQEITGNTAASSAQGSDVPLGTDSDLNPPFVELQAFTVAKASDGAESYIQKIWHKVQINNVTVTQQGEQEFKVTMEGTAFQTATSVTGAALASKRIATLKAVLGAVPA